MKKLSFAFIVIAFMFGVGLTSCSKDEKGGKVEKDDVLYKTWYKPAGYDGSKDVYDELTFNADGTFKLRILTMSFNYRTINGTYQIVGRTTDYDEDDYVGGFLLMGIKAKTKFTIEFIPSIDDIDVADIFYCENRDDRSKKGIYFTSNLSWEDDGHDRLGYYDDRKY